MLWPIDVRTALDLSSRLVAIAVLISTLELVYLAGKGEFSSGGVWDWYVLKAVSMPRSGYFDPFVKGSKSFILLLLVRCFGAFALTTFGVDGIVAYIALILLVTC